MLDIKFIRENKELILDTLIRRNYEFDLDLLIKLHDKYLGNLSEIETLRARRNALPSKPTPESIQEGTELKEQIKALEEINTPLYEEFLENLKDVPNILHNDCPTGKGEADNLVLEMVGEAKKYDFSALHHDELAESLDLISFEGGVKVAQSGFYFLKNELAQIELALVQYIFSKTSKMGFTPLITPELINSKTAEGTGYLPRREEADVYKLENEDLYLSATAEIPVASLHSGEIFKSMELPKKYVAFSSCFRKERGAYGKHRRGIFRVHQFDKVELFAITTPGQSDEMFFELINTTRSILEDLKISYRVVNICSGDMNGAGHLKYDLEYFSKVDGEYREISSGTNCTDYQARRLNIKVESADNKKQFVHTLNNTAIPISRGLIAIMENYQDAQGNLHVPDCLQKYLDFTVIKPHRIS